MMTPVSKKVAVIGAGPSGLVCLKELLAEGHQPVCFEKSTDLGGVYRYDENAIGVYRSVRLTSSALITSFSDFPPPKKSSLHFKHDEYFQYLMEYAQYFQLLGHVRFQHAVKEVKQLMDGRWQIVVNRVDTATEEIFLFDAVAVCAGVHQNPFVPDFQGRDDFKGLTLHSAWYKSPEVFQNKNVVIVGGGESGSDIVEEVANVAQSCVLALRRGVLVIPRRIFNQPNDYFTTRLFYSVPDWFVRMKHKTKFHWPTLTVILLSLLVLAGHNRLLEWLLTILYYVSPVAMGLVTFVLDLTCVVLYLCLIGIIWKNSLSKEALVIANLSRLSGAGHGEQFATKCEGMAKAISQGKCQLKSGIEKLTSHSVVFEDGTEIPADAIIYCTGFAVRFSFLGNERMDCRNLYKNCFDPIIGGTLCFVGLARPAIGAIPPIAEMQARWFSLLMSEKCRLPSNEQMKNEIEINRKEHQERFAVVSDRITGLVDFTSYMDELAAYVGCLPPWRLLLKDPLVLFRIYFNPFMACQYRLFGPHAKREEARRLMLKTPLGITRFLYNYSLLCVVVLCEMLYSFGFKFYKPRLRLWQKI